MSAVPDSLQKLDNELTQIMFFDREKCQILVAREQLFNHRVRSEIQRIRLQNPDVKYEMVTVSMEEIAERRNQTVDETENVLRSDTEMQKAALDLFKKAVKDRTSDIHIRVSTVNRCQILFRINGDLVMVEEHTTAYGEQLCSTIYQSIADVGDSTYDINTRQDARIAKPGSLPNELDGIRIATTPQVDGSLMVLRLLYDASGASDDVTSLGYSDIQRSRIQILKKRPTGVTLIAGPTGSGKSTTLQRVFTSLIRETKGRKNVLTVEDPPEYPIPGAIQTPVKNAITEEERSAAFQQAIKGAMRVDPDVIMIGEIRDAPSAKLAIQAAMTGHQVWSSIHANGAFNTIDRMIDLGVDLNVMTDPNILSGMLCQRLLKTLCKCKKPYTEVWAKYREEREGFDQDHDRLSSVLDLKDIYVRGDGCDECRGKGAIVGTNGRTVVAEVVVTDQQMMQYVRNKDITAAIQHWKEAQRGMTMVEHALQKVRLGLVDPFDTEDVVGPLDEGASMMTYSGKQEA